MRVQTEQAQPTQGHQPMPAYFWQSGIACMMVRGGTSKGAYFLAEDLPQDTALRDKVLLALLGSPDARQIDGIGGAHPLTSKVAIISRSDLPSCDLDFLFCQLGVDKAMVDTTPNCGNILSGVAPFALERGLIIPTHPQTRITVRTLNTGTLAELVLDTPNSIVRYEGNARIDGVPGTASPIALDFLDAAGSVCGALLPTGHVCDVVNGIPVTLIDNGMPVIVVSAKDMGVGGYEAHTELDNNTALKARIEALRLASAPLMKLGDVSKKAIPKIALVAPPRNGGAITTRCFIPHECHSSIGVFAAVTIATAAVMKGSPAYEVASLPEGATKTLSVEHPTGEFSVRLVLDGATDAPKVLRAGLLRTARPLFDGKVFLRENVAQEWRQAESDKDLASKATHMNKAASASHAAA